MQAIKLEACVGNNHRLNIQLPENFPTGNVEVIVLTLTPSHESQSTTSVETPDTERRHHLNALFSMLDAEQKPSRAKDDIDRQIAAERDSWD